MKKYYVYVIKSIEGYHYTGMTEDLELRLNNIMINLCHFGPSGAPVGKLFTLKFLPTNPKL